MGNEFSVLMLVYGGDRPAQFDAALRSIAAQTLPPAEIVLVVDGPVPEGTEEVIRKYEAELADSATAFRVIRSERNLGCGGAKRLGFGECRYPLIAMMDADDLSVPDRFEKQARYFAGHPDTDAAGGYITEFVSAEDPTDVSRKDVRDMTKEMQKVDGVKSVIGIDSLLGAGIPEAILPENVLSLVKGDRYQLMLVNSAYVISSDEVNAQIDSLNGILKKYDKGGMLIGEAPCTKDLIACTDRDFTVVSLISILAIFVIIMLVQRSFSLPVLLVAVIELAIAANLCIPYYLKQELPFVGPILISTIQLGATVDYAILMTTRYRQNRLAGKDKKEAVQDAVASAAQSVLVSGLGFFAATYGVGLYSNVAIISTMCRLIARGALLSVAVVLLLLPAVLLIIDKVIVHTTAGMKKAAC